MHIAQIAHGLGPVPPKEWGAVEMTIWQYKVHLERLGHQVDVFNTPLINQVLHAINTGTYDFVHCHNELFAGHLHAHLRQPYVVTAHHGGLYQFEPGGDRYPELEYPFADCLRAPGYFALHERTCALLTTHGYSGFMRLVRNAVECTPFRVAARGNGKAICVGFVEPRKRQGWLARAAAGRVQVDIVGPWDWRVDGLLDENDTVHYLGVWDRPTLYEKLTDYSALVLLSESEGGTPKVVLEALAAGLSVVISDACDACLDPKPFIHVLPHDRLDPETTVERLRTAIRENASWRRAIRTYAVERFDYAVVVPDYVAAIEAFRAHTTAR